MTLRVRHARVEDAQALTALVMASKQSVGYDDAFMAACADELRVTPDLIDQKLFWVAEEVTTDAIPLGCARLDIQGSTGEIHAFFIHADHKRKGIGRALWRIVKETALAENLDALILDAEPTAVPFYEALGFAIIGERPSGSIPGRTLPQMKLTLDR